MTFSVDAFRIGPRKVRDDRELSVATSIARVVVRVAVLWFQRKLFEFSIKSQQVLVDLLITLRCFIESRHVEGNCGGRGDSRTVGAKRAKSLSGRCSSAKSPSDSPDRMASQNETS